MFFFLLSFILSFVFFLLFFLVMKDSLFVTTSSGSFECGFTSYFFSRFSFSIHYFYISLIFLFLDLELILIMPLIGSPLSCFDTYFNLVLFLLFLFLGFLEEWGSMKLEWNF